MQTQPGVILIIADLIHLPGQMTESVQPYSNPGMKHLQEDRLQRLNEAEALSSPGLGQHQAMIGADHSATVVVIIGRNLHLLHAKDRGDESEENRREDKLSSFFMFVPTYLLGLS